ncbi:hypothetical protein GXP67_17105 [Rhodocytophaga rosea]|uniref:T9SS C-terminal target domain-containing protein n=1 Tax=Rhodocytophaga rosea TaxID=2704465 RepID=A0A6C0GJW6_9BACT|nr:hypothetical protein [Rhodocytophaga rosea]QHT68237.1 hypothetical protein GXP67_17105 [Rhodocytophaga rosea]
MYLYPSTQKSIKTTSTNFSGKAANYRTSTTALLIKVCLFTVCLLSLIIDLAQAQATPVKEWDKRFGGSNEDRAKKIIPTADGGFLVGGHSYSSISGDKTAANKGAIDYWVVKISSDGTKQWDKSFGGDGFDDLTSLIQTSDGGFLLAGHSDSGVGGDKSQASKGDSDYWIVKTTSDGTKQWDKSFGGDGFDDLTSLIQTSDGGFLVGGHSYSGISGDKTAANKGADDYWIVKITSNAPNNGINPLGATIMSI